MKIENGNGIAKPQAGPSAKTPKSDPSGGFSKIFEQQVARGGLAPEAGQVSGPAPAGAIDFARPMVRPAAAVVLDRIESLLDRLDQYCQCLADPENSLQQASSVLEQVAYQADDLQKLAGNTGMDSQLDSLVQETLTTVLMARVRFQRGDYC